MPDLTNAIFTELMRGVEDEAHRRGYMVLLARAEGMADGEEAIPRLIGEGRVDGVLVQVGDNMRPQDLQSLVEGSLPVVFVELGPAAGRRVGGARGRARHPHRPPSTSSTSGHRRIGLHQRVLRPPTPRGAARPGFRQAMADAGLAVPDDHVTRLGYYPHSGGAALRRAGRARPPPTAVVVANVNAAHGALREARRLGLRVPEDLSIVAMHDAWTAENAWPPLTTVQDAAVRARPRRRCRRSSTASPRAPLSDIVVARPRAGARGARVHRAASH